MSVHLDIGLLITAFAAALAFGRGLRSEQRRAGWLRQTLLIAWVTGAIAIVSGQPMSTVVFLAAVVDLMIGGVALAISTADRTRIDARVVGSISMCLMPAHWTVSMAQGLPSDLWMVYAVSCNGAFVVQCLVTGGWLDGLGRGIGSILSRIRIPSLFRVWRR